MCRSISDFTNAQTDMNLLHFHINHKCASFQWNHSCYEMDRLCHCILWGFVKRMARLTKNIDLTQYKVQVRSLKHIGKQRFNSDWADAQTAMNFHYFHCGIKWFNTKLSEPMEQTGHRLIWSFTDCWISFPYPSVHFLLLSERKRRKSNNYKKI